MDQVLEEIPRVREDLGYIALVTPTSQIVGTQAVLNVLTGERYKSITKETAGVLRGEYGSTPAPVNPELQGQVLEAGEEPVTCRPADNLAPEMEQLTAELEQISRTKGIEVAENEVDDVLIYALFPQVGLKFLENRGNPAAFEPPPWEESGGEKADVAKPVPGVAAAPQAEEAYRVEVNGRAYDVKVSPQGIVKDVAPSAVVSPQAAGGTEVPAPLAGNIFKVKVTPGQHVEAGQVVVVLEAMKMETEVRAPRAGTVAAVGVKDGDSVQVGDILLTLA
jgi:oxaloacetate decarboxylase alpha subunit